MPTFPIPRMTQAVPPVPWRVLTRLGFGAAVSLAAITATVPQLLVNTTASEPEGLYRRISAPPVVGRLIAFKAPSAAFPYADSRLGYLHQVPLLKTVAAGPGDAVCALDGRLVIAGRDRAPIARVDRQGRALPHWEECRRLRAGELFVFSDRVASSFDSRYFGPIARQAVLGVYTPLVVASGGAG